MLQIVPRVSREEITYPDLERNHLGLSGWQNSLDFMRELEHVKGIRWENQSQPLMVPYVGLSLRLFQFMAVLFLWLLVLSIDYRFVLKIPFWGLFIHGKGANILAALGAVVFKIALKCYHSER